MTSDDLRRELEFARADLRRYEEQNGRFKEIAHREVDTAFDASARSATGALARWAKQLGSRGGGSVILTDELKRTLIEAATLGGPDVRAAAHAAVDASRGVYSTLTLEAFKAGVAERSRRIQAVETEIRELAQLEQKAARA